MTLASCAFIGLALWIGGWALMIGVVTPVIFRAHNQEPPLIRREEAERLLGVLFPAVDRWTLVWGGVTAGTLAALFLNRHFEPRSLVIEIPVGLMFLLNLHSVVILHPQIRELKRKINLPHYQGTSHQQTMQNAFNRLHLRSVQLHGLLLFLGIFVLGLCPRFLR